MLTAKEYNLIKDHPVWGARVLETFEDLQDVARYVRFHHERWDGLGYPEGIEGEDIPLISRILSVADALEAMTSDRPYREKISLAEALKEIEKNAGTQFDPKIAQMAVKSIKRLS
jgi:polar amino acid transport system substrate-binding protein